MADEESSVLSSVAPGAAASGVVDAPGNVSL